MIRKPDGSLDFENMISHVGALVDEGLDVAAVSTAHGFTEGVGSTVKALRQAFPNLTLIGGNVTNGAGVEFLAKCGADAIKIGQGPGSICTTRIVAGVGIPQLTALYVCSKTARELGVRTIADGGITKSGDMVKALTLADAMICGGLLAGLPGSSRAGYGNQWKDVQTVPRYGKLVRNEGRQRGKVRARYKK